MDKFMSIFLGMGLCSMFCDDWSDNFDVLGSLPLEVAIIILRKLDPKSLLTAVRVCRKWMRIVKSDKILRETVRDELIRQKNERMKKEMFFSAAVAARISIASGSGPKETKRQFEVSVKNVSKPSKKRKIAWDCSTTKVRRLR